MERDDNLPVTPPGHVAVPIEELTDLRRIKVEAKYREVLRLCMLYILAAGAGMTGLMIAVTAPTQGPSFTLIGDLPGWPVWWGLTLAVSGAVMAVSVWMNRPNLLGISCALAAVWYLAFAFAFAVQFMNWVNNGAEGFNPSVYPVSVYGALGLAHIVNFLLLLHFRLMKSGGNR